MDSTSQAKKPRVLNRSDYKHGDLPDGAIYVARPTAFGNPFHIPKDGDRLEVIRKFEAYLLTHPALVERIKKELRGHDLACWCAPKPCHADVLLRIANEP